MIEERGNTLIASGDVGYEQAGEFAGLCDRFLRKRRTGEAVIDLSRVGDLVSPCLTAIYEDARLHRPASLLIVVPARLESLLVPGEAEGLFKLQVL